jgi:PAS domain S-box-containing protein
MSELNRKIEILYRIIVSANQAGDLASLLDAILESTLEMIGFDAGGIYLLDEKAGTILLHSHRGLPPGFIAEVRRYSMSDRLAGHLLVEKNPLYIEKVDEFKPEWARKYGIATIAAIPLIYGDRAIGTLNLSSNTSHLFTPEDRDILNAIGRETGASIARMQAETALRESEHRYKELADSLPESVYEIDLEGNLLFVNATAYRVFDYPDDALENTLNVFTMIDDRDTERAAHDFSRLLAGEWIGPVEYLVKRRDGSTFPAVLHSVPTVRNGALSGFHGVLIDASVINRTKEALRESEAKFRAVAETTASGIYIWQNDRFVYANPAMERVSGYSIQELLSMEHFERLIHPEFIPFMRERIARRRTREMMPMRYELRVITKNGNDIWIDLSSSAILYDNRPAVIGTFFDITERKRVEEALRSSEENFRTIIDSVNDALFVHDIETAEILQVNRRAIEMYGIRNEELSTLDYQRLCMDEPPFTTEEAMRHFRRAVDEGFHVFEWLTAGLRGRRFWVEMSLRRALIGGRERLLAVVRDITDRKRAEEELARSQKLESLGVLAGGIAHDFNNILTVVTGNISLARMQTTPESGLNRVLRDAEQASFRARDLTQQLLTFSRGGAPIKKVTSIAALLEETIRFTLSGTNIRPEFDIAGDLWAAEVDPGQMSQVFNNLAINAQQAMPAGGTVRVRARNASVSGPDGDARLKPGRYLKISVEDHGIGIPAELQPRIFDPYFTTKQRGSGLGLTTTYSIINRHGGHIEVDSKVGEGTSFTLHLPATEGKPRRARTARKHPSRSRGRVLIMDDDEAVLAVGAEMLRTLGYTAETACDGNSAIMLYERFMETGAPFDAVILDLTIPGGPGGLDTLKKLVGMDERVRAVVSSGYSSDPVMSDYREHGFAGVVAKPYNIEEMAAVLEAVIRPASR